MRLVFTIGLPINCA